MAACTCIAHTLPLCALSAHASHKDALHAGPSRNGPELHVCQVAIMKGVGASKRLGHLVEGESLLNDSSIYVFFSSSVYMYTGAERSNGEHV